ncbi:hypothetical protein IFM89_020018 [Coptis chinensis]|uniref:non-specific serine/threonine protein kinase n=1 Tax=Coptis chinensis TaxID=261450 RepID=A0A835IQ84_9MAGN|nr:hypothetical protein IFM89_020018 [Coptis chinensis]
MMKFGKNLKLNFSSSLLNSSASSKVKKSVSNSPRVVNPVPKNNCFPNKKMKKEVSPACSSSNTCIADVDSALSPSASKVVCQAQNSNQNVLKEPACPAFSRTCLDVNVSLSNADYKANKSVQGLDSCNKRNFDAKASECSRSREAADFSQSSKSSLGAYSSTTCISDESNVCGSSCSGSRPHMSKDLRWEAIRRVEMQHGSLDLRHFKLLKRLGCGDLGTVYLAELTGTNCLFAVKIMDNESLGSRKKMPRALTERDILQVLDHPFLPTLFAYFTTNKFSILVMEYCPGGDLHILRQKQPGSIFTEQAARFYVAEVLLALEYLHMLGIVYRDLKPENILVREDGHIMLSDFDLSLRCTVKPTLVKASLSLPTPPKGISGSCVGCICTDPFCVQPSWVQVPCFTPRHVSTPTNIRKLKSNSMTQVPQLLAEPTNARSHSFVGTHEYLAPEIIRGEGHGNAVDWWTFGIFLYELLFGTTPFKGPGNDDKFPESSSVSSQAKDLIRGLLRKEPKDRFGSAKGAAEIRKHPFFKGLNWALIRCAVPPTVPKSSETGVSLTTAEENKLVEYKMSSAEHPEFDTF